jgi:hypothetical protein
MKIFTGISILVGSLFLAACASYHAGTPENDLKGSSIYVAPAKNDSLAPQAQALVTDAVVKAILTDGSLTVTRAADADLTLEITLVDYDRHSLSKNKLDTGLSRNETITLDALITLKDNHTGKAIFTNRKVHADGQAFFDNGQTSAERDAMPKLARELSERILTELIGQW